MSVPVTVDRSDYWSEEQPVRSEVPLLRQGFDLYNIFFRRLSIKIDWLIWNALHFYNFLMDRLKPVFSASSVRLFALIDRTKSVTLIHPMHKNNTYNVPKINIPGAGISFIYSTLSSFVQPLNSLFSIFPSLHLYRMIFSFFVQKNHLHILCPL